MAEENKEKTETELIKELRQEYELKLAKQKEEYETKIDTINKTNKENLKALISGREVKNTKEIEKENEKSFFEKAVEETKNKLKLK